MVRSTVVALAAVFGAGQVEALGCGGCKKPAAGKDAKAAAGCAKCAAAAKPAAAHCGMCAKCCAPTTPADEKPAAGQDVKLTGSLMCGKCRLKLEGVKKCTNALQVKEGEKTVTYLLDDKGNGEDYHECGGDVKENVTVEGKLAEKDGRKWVKPTKVDVKK